MAELGSARDALLFGPKFLHFHAVFGKNGQITCWRPIMDSPAEKSWIRHLQTHPVVLGQPVDLQWALGRYVCVRTCEIGGVKDGWIGRYCQSLLSTPHPFVWALTTRLKSLVHLHWRVQGGAGSNFFHFHVGFRKIWPNNRLVCKPLIWVRFDSELVKFCPYFLPFCLSFGINMVWWLRMCQQNKEDFP